LRRGLFSVYVTRRVRPTLKREHRLPGHSIEDEHLTVLGRQRDRVNCPAAMLEGYERRRRRKVPVPDVVIDRLKMPETPARLRVEREQRVRVQIVAVAVRAVEVRRRRSG